MTTKGIVLRATEQSVKKGKERSSNIELLRIISMLFVVLVHLDGGCLGIPNLEGDWSQMDCRTLWRLGVESFVFIGVNCFTLISGYFAIRLKWKGITGYLFQCLFYAVGVYGVLSFFIPGLFSWKGLGESCLVLTHTDLWYVPAYFMLMLLSPLLNAGFDALSRRRSLLLTTLLVIFNLWAGWWWGGKFNPSGYTAWQLVMMYCIGRVIATYRDGLLTFRRRVTVCRGGRIWLGIYLIASLLTVAIGVYDFRRGYSYNQPMVVLASTAFFLFFVSLDFKSKIINYAAKSAFAVYLLHKSPLIWGRYLRPEVIKLWNETSLSEFTLYVIVLMIGIYAVSMIIDSLRRRVAKMLGL